MTRLRTLLHANRRGVWFLVAFTLALRALLPGGTMPVGDIQHGIHVILCDGTGAMAAKANPHGSRHGHADGHRCPYSVLVVSAVSGDFALAAPEVQLVPDDAPASQPTTVDARGYERLRPPQRGPPRFV